MNCYKQIIHVYLCTGIELGYNLIENVHVFVCMCVYYT